MKQCGEKAVSERNFAFHSQDERSFDSPRLFVSGPQFKNFDDNYAPSENSPLTSTLYQRQKSIRVPRLSSQKFLSSMKGTQFFRFRF
jgi:hypothetical protein